VVALGPSLSSIAITRAKTCSTTPSVFWGGGQVVDLGRGWWPSSAAPVSRAPPTAAGSVLVPSGGGSVVGAWTIVLPWLVRSTPPPVSSLPRVEERAYPLFPLPRYVLLFILMTYESKQLRTTNSNIVYEFQRRRIITTTNVDSIQLYS